MKVLFVYPNSGSQVGFNYGVASMSAVLKAAGHEVGCLQLCEELEPLPDRQRFADYLRNTRADVIGFSVVTNQWALAQQYAAWCRDVVSAPVVCGGVHATVATEQVLRSGSFDYVFVGECEEAFLEFVERLSRGENVADLRNLGRVCDGEVRINPVRPLPDLTRLPRKDYSIFSFQKMIDAKHGWVGLMASRGCPFNCTYCFNHVMVKKYRTDLQCSVKDLHYIRHHRVPQLLDEIRHLETTYRNITMYIFDDDLFTFDEEFVAEFCRAYPQASTRPFVVNGHVGFFEEACARALASAGCRIVKFGVESGSEQIRRQVMHRHMSNAQIREAIRLVEGHGMHSSCFLMLGTPGETRDDVMKTIELMAQAKPGRYRWTYFFPFAGTESYEMSAAGGYIDETKLTSLVNFTDASCLDFGPEQNLFLEKVGCVFPWFVNGASDLAVAPFYREETERILAMPAAAWREFAPTAHRLDKEYSQRFAAEGKRHYALKYNPFMGVRSDYFLKEG